MKQSRSSRSPLTSVIKVQPNHKDIPPEVLRKKKDDFYENLKLANDGQFRSRGDYSGSPLRRGLYRKGFVNSATNY